MQIWLHHLDGTTENVTLETITNMLGSVRLVAQGSHLSTENADSLLFENANVYVNGELDGGKKKKKKKVYTTKKKGHHIHKRVKMGIYSLYSVDGTYALIQAKATSPNSAKPVLPAALASLWLSTGTVTTAASATPPSRWTPKPSRRTKKS